MKLKNDILCILLILKHKFFVLYYILKFCKRLIIRGLKHDLSKFSKLEFPLFSKNINKFRNCEYNSKEYKECLDNIKPALDNHYKLNSHHPQYYINGIKEMTPLDLIECLADWAAAIKNNKNGSLYSSLKVNQKKFDYSVFDYYNFERDYMETNIIC